MRWELRGTRARRSVWAGLLFATFPIAWWLRPLIIEDHIPVCLFRIATTKPCPFCGLTRAFAHATHGEFGLAWESNPLWFLAVALIATLAVLMATDAAAGTDTFDRFMRRLDRWLVPVVVGLTIFGIWRVLR